MKKKAAVAMSGGVDSSVAAWLLKEQGYEVAGFTLKLHEFEGEGPNYGGCCSIDSVDDARSVAQKLDIPFYVLNFKESFSQNVIDKFVGQYLAGQTPNPCVECNRSVKFDVMFDQMRRLGMDFLATGHYVRKSGGEEGGPYRLLRGADRDKDQSYVLYMLNQERLGRLLFPVGEYRKEEIRAMAREAGLRVAGKPDSQEICFVPDNDYAAFIRENYPGRAGGGEIVDESGVVLGRHDGIFNFTVGQRRGLGVAAGEPLYVKLLDAKSGAVTVSPWEGLQAGGLIAGGLSFISGAFPQQTGRMQAKIRYNATPVDVARMTDLGGGAARVEFSSPVFAVAPGQSVVFYAGEETLGGGIIAKSLSVESRADVK